jgi:peptidoglycan hydrolase-like protein with peptidoglycan-binding domain
LRNRVVLVSRPHSPWSAKIRRTLTGGLLILGLIIGSFFVAPAGAAAAAPENEYRSFPGCPLLVERFSGDCVERLQHQLNGVLAAYNLDEDGVFGEGTRIAVLDFQGRNHLPADGNVGGITADELQRQYDATQPPPPPPGSAEDCPNDQGMVRGSNGECVADGVVGGGKSLIECIQELTIDEASARAIEHGFTTGKFSSWKEAVEELKSNAGVKALGRVLSAAEAFKCGWWDIPDDNS